MRQPLVLALALVPLAACGGKSAPSAPPANEVVADDTAGGNTYGGFEYGGYGGEYDGEYGGGEYGGYGYGGYDQPYVPPPPVAPNLVGSWSTGCVGTAKPYHQVVHVYTDTRWDVRSGEFSDAACTKRTSEQHHGGTYAFGVESATLAPAWEVTFTADVREITADDKASAKAISKACGVKLKAKGTADVMAKGCPSLGVAAACAAEYDVATIEADRLRLGAGDACAVEQRPTALETTVDLVYQWQPTGISECDALIASLPTMLACKGLPAEVKTSVFDAYRQMESMIRTQLAPTSPPEAVKATTDACKQAKDAMPQALASMGC